MTAEESLLNGVRVLDLCDETGVFCTKLLATLGADVIKIERPGGDRTRGLGPFFKDQPHPEHSLHWWLYNLGKRSITLNIETPEGKDLFRRLVGTADILVETATPGYLDGLGLDYTNLSKVNPGLVHTAITPFGRTGPYAQYRANDLVLNSLGGFCFQCGAPDTPPTNMSVPSLFVMAGAQAAAGTLIAWFHRQQGGEGQFVDVSIQEAVAWIPKPYDMLWRAEGVLQTRGPMYPLLTGHASVESDWCRYFRTRDGYVCAWPNYASHRQDMRRWLAEEGLDGDLVRPEYDGYFAADAATDASLTLAANQKLGQAFEALARRYTADELFKEGQRRGIQVAPVNAPPVLLKDPHLQARDYFLLVEHPEEGVTLSYQGKPIGFSDAPYRAPQRAPLIGEHNSEVYLKELGLSPETLQALQELEVI